MDYEIEGDIDIKHRKLNVLIWYRERKTTEWTPGGPMNLCEISNIKVKDRSGNDITDKLFNKYPETHDYVTYLIDMDRGDHFNE